MALQGELRGLTVQFRSFLGLELKSGARKHACRRYRTAVLPSWPLKSTEFVRAQPRRLRQPQESEETILSLQTLSNPMNEMCTFSKVSQYMFSKAFPHVIGFVYIIEYFGLDKLSTLPSQVDCINSVLYIPYRTCGN